MRMFVFLVVLIFFQSSCTESEKPIEEPELLKLNVSVLDDFFIPLFDHSIVFVSDESGKNVFSRKIFEGDEFSIDLLKEENYHFSIFKFSSDNRYFSLDTYSYIDTDKSIIIGYEVDVPGPYEKDHPLNIFVNTSVKLLRGMISFEDGYKDDFLFSSNYPSYEIISKGPLSRIKDKVLVSIQYPDGKWKYIFNQLNEPIYNYRKVKFNEEDLKPFVNYMELPRSKMKSILYSLHLADKRDDLFYRGFFVSSNNWPFIIPGARGEIGFIETETDYIVNLHGDLNEFRNVSFEYNSIGGAPKSVNIPYEIIPEKDNNSLSNLDLTTLKNVSYFEAFNFLEFKGGSSFGGGKISMQWTVFGDGRKFQLNEFPAEIRDVVPQIDEFLADQGLSISVYKTPTTYQERLSKAIYGDFSDGKDYYSNGKRRGEYYKIFRNF